MTDKEQPKPETILLKAFDPPIKIPDGHELVVSHRSEGGAVTSIRVDLELVEKSDDERAGEAFDRIVQHMGQSAVAVLEVSAVAWSHVAGRLQWAARKVGARSV